MTLRNTRCNDEDNIYNNFINFVHKHHKITEYRSEGTNLRSLQNLAPHKIERSRGSDYVWLMSDSRSLLLPIYHMLKYILHHAWNYSILPTVKELRFCVRCAFLTQHCSDIVALSNAGCMYSPCLVYYNNNHALFLYGEPLFTDLK